MFCSPFTVNLSSSTLSIQQVELLDKGLSFIPSVSNIPLTNIVECKRRNIRNLLIRDFFQNSPKHDYDPSAFENNFVSKSTWNPPLIGISDSVKSICNNLATYTHDMVSSRLTHSTKGLTSVFCGDLLLN